MVSKTTARDILIYSLKKKVIDEKPCFTPEKQSSFCEPHSFLHVSGNDGREDLRAASDEAVAGAARPRRTASCAALHVGRSCRALQIHAKFLGSGERRVRAGFTQG